MNNKIVIDIRMINKSGIGVYIKELIPKITEYFKDVSFYLLSHKHDNVENKFCYKNVSYIYINSKVYSMNEQFEIIRKVPKRVDLYWSPHYVFPIFLSSNILLTIHDIYHLKYSNHFIKRLYAKILFTCIKIKNISIICVSNFTRKELNAFSKIDDNKINTIYNGISRYWRNLSYNRKKYILCVSNLKRNKNILNLVKAYLQVQDDISEDLYIIGDYTNIKDIDTDSVELIKQTPRINLLGHKTKEELIKYYNEAKVYIHPSKYEGFGFPPLEAIACNCAVLASNNSCIPEICKDAALYFGPDDIKQISQLIKNTIDDDDIKNKLINNGKDIIEHYNWSNCALKTIDVIEQIIK